MRATWYSSLSFGCARWWQHTVALRLCSAHRSCAAHRSLFPGQQSTWPSVFAHLLPVARCLLPLVPRPSSLVARSSLLAHHPSVFALPHIKVSAHRIGFIATHVWCLLRFFSRLKLVLSTRHAAAHEGSLYALSLPLSPFPLTLLRPPPSPPFSLSPPCSPLAMSIALYLDLFGHGVWDR